MLKERWSKGKEAGCVVSDTPNRHGVRDDHVNYYGGYLIAESIPSQTYVNLIARAPSMLALLEKAYPIIEEEAERRESAMRGDSDRNYTAGDYWTEMRQLANTIQAEIAKAKGDPIIDAELCPHGYGFVEYCEDCKKEVKTNG